MGIVLKILSIIGFVFATIVFKRFLSIFTFVIFNSSNSISFRKIADFSFEDGFMGSAKMYKGIDSYVKYDFLKEINKGILSGITNYSKEIPEGDVTVYYLNWQRMEGKYLNGRLMGKVIFYDKNNKINMAK